MYFLYSTMMAVVMLVLAPYFFLRGLRQPDHWQALKQRFGWLPEEVRSDVRGAIWIHAVSVGEALAALPLAQRLKEKFPGRRLVVSTTTATGQSTARERIGFADAVFYFPLDWRGPVRRAFRVVRPSVVVILETEIWPNFLREARREGVPVVFANARVSDRSLRRYRLTNRFLFGFLARVLSDASCFLAQSEEDAARLRRLGASPAKVIPAGNLKYDSTPPRSGPFATWLEGAIAQHGRRPLVVAGSVSAGEEPLVLIAFGIVQGQWQPALLILAPRKPDRFNAAATEIAQSQRTYLRRSQICVNGTQPASLDESVSVILLDTVGELAPVYRLADAVFVGGSLVPDGGHNILEPAGYGRPPLFGPSMENFREAAARFTEAKAGRQVHSAEDLGAAWVDLIQDAGKRERMGSAALELVERNRGATDRAVDTIVAVLQAAEGQQLDAPRVTP